MNIAILGAGGFVGGRLTRHLLAVGHRVLTITRTAQTPLGPGHTPVSAAIGDREALRPLLENSDFLFHLACDSTPGSTHHRPTAEGTDNILPSLALLALLQELSRPCLVFVSSGGAIYRADPGSPPSDEGSPVAPKSYYGAGKLAVELFIEAYQQQTGNRAVILRPSNLYGPGQHAKRQFGVIPTLLRAARDGSPFEIWGDGSARRDYLYIDDFLDLCQRVIAGDGEDRPLEVFNAGSGEGATILELCDRVEAITGRPLQRAFGPGRTVDMPVARLDTGKVQRTLGWQARTGLDEGLERTWQWFLDNSPESRA